MSPRKDKPSKLDEAAVSLGGSQDDFKAAEAHTQRYRDIMPQPRVIPWAGTDDRSPYAPKDGPKRRQVILDWLAAGWSLTYAAQQAGIHPMTLKEWRAKDAAFDEQCKAAMEYGTDRIEDAARFRAVEGVVKPVYQKGECVGHVVEHSDSLMQMMLGGRRPTKFGKTKVEHSGPDGGAVPVKIIEVVFK